MKAWPIRWKISGWTGALIGVALLTYSVFTLLNLYHEQIEAIDLELEADARRLIELPTLADAQRAAADNERFAKWKGYALFDELGEIRYRSKRLPESIARGTLTEAKVHTRNDGANRWRAEAMAKNNYTLVAAYDLDEVHDIMVDLVIAYALSLPVVVVIAAAGGWWVSGRALQPLHDLAVSVENVQAQSLDHRVTVPRANDEVQRLSIVFNAMLGRLEKSFEQAQRFAADASHELRTPLTIIRGEIERLMHAPGIGPAHQVKLVSVQEEIERLQHITDTLLLLARLDSGNAVFANTPFNLTDLVQEACSDAELLGTGRAIRIESQLQSDVWVTGDEAHIRRVVLNLLDNAVKFNVPEGVVRCVLTTKAKSAALRIGNSGPGIGREARAQLFRRFFRADPSRNGAQKGHGLGLSLSLEIVRAHQGDLQLTDTTSTWTEFEMTLPGKINPDSRP